MAEAKSAGSGDPMNRLKLGMLLVAAAHLIVAGEAWARPEPSLSELLEEARHISLTRHWQEAQNRLDELADRLEQAEQRDRVEFHLLEARHLILADQSRAALERLAGLLELELPDDQRLRALQLGANVSVLLRQYERGFEYLGEALSLAVDPGAAEPRIATLNLASYLLGRVGEVGRGIEHGEAALAMARGLGDRNEQCIAMQRLAPVYKWAEQFERAERTYRDGMSVCQDVGNQLFVGVIAQGLADLLRQQGRLQEARDLATESIELLQRAVYPLGEFEARLVLAEIKADAGTLSEIDPAELERLADYFAADELWDQAARLSALRARLAEQAGEWVAAVDFLHEQLRVREAFLGRERSMRLAFLQVEFDTRLQARELVLLRESARVSELEARALSQQTQLRGLIILLIALLTVGLLLMLVRAQRSRRHFRNISRQDQLSGLVNHTWFFQRAQTLLNSADAATAPGSLALVAADIDRFKLINDVFGHRIGDEVLGRTARRLREVFPEHALIGRIGGEEFAVLVRAADIDQVVAWIEAFRRQQPQAVRTNDPEVTVSFGLSCYQPGDDIETLRERADRALYQAKRDGRDCYRLDDSCRAGRAA